MDAIGHLVAGHELSPGRMSRNDNRAEIGKQRWPRHLSEDLVGQVERREPAAAGGATGPPAVAVTRPVQLPGGQRVAAGQSIAGRETGRDDKRVIQGTLEPGRCQPDLEMPVGLAIRSVHDDENPADAVVAGIERKGSVDERPAGLAEGHPFRACACLEAGSARCRICQPEQHSDYQNKQHPRSALPRGRLRPAYGHDRPPPAAQPDRADDCNLPRCPGDLLAVRDLARSERGAALRGADIHPPYGVCRLRHWTGVLCLEPCGIRPLAHHHPPR